MANKSNNKYVYKIIKKLSFSIENLLYVFYKRQIIIILKNDNVKQIINMWKFISMWYTYYEFFLKNNVCNFINKNKITILQIVVAYLFYVLEGFPAYFSV